MQLFRVWLFVTNSAVGCRWVAGYNWQMSTPSLLPVIFPAPVVVETVMTDTELFISIQAITTTAKCPICSTESSRHHSSYLRSVQDTPIGLCLVWLQLKVRRFRCANQNCKQQTFAEQQLDLVDRRRRRTKRLLSNLVQIGVTVHPPIKNSSTTHDTAWGMSGAAFPWRRSAMTCAI